MDEIKEKVTEETSSIYSKLSSVDKKIVVSFVGSMIFFAIASLIFSFAPLRTNLAFIFTMAGVISGLRCAGYLICLLIRNLTKKN